MCIKLFLFLEETWWKRWLQASTRTRTDSNVKITSSPSHHQHHHRHHGDIISMTMIIIINIIINMNITITIFSTILPCFQEIHLKKVSGFGLTGFLLYFLPEKISFPSSYLPIFGGKVDITSGTNLLTCQHHHHLCHC